MESSHSQQLRWPLQSEENIETVLNIWFDYHHHPQTFYNREIWWEKNEKFDRALREQFTPLWEKAVGGELNNWLKTPKGTLAYIVLIDQFSRNMFRHSKKMYEYDYLAVSAAKHAVKKGFDRSLSYIERVFIYLPFEHSEKIDEQQESVRLFSELVNDVPEEAKPLAQKYLQYAKDHCDIVTRFRRFPHRNTIVERNSTAEEAEFLKGHSGY